MKKCLFLMLMLVSVCAMGQEDYFVSTKKKDLPKEQFSEERKFVEANFKYVNIVDWKKGMKFIQVKKSEPYTYMVSSAFSNTGKSLEDYYGQILTVDTIIEEYYYPQGLQERIRTLILLTSASGDTITYKADTDKEDMRFDISYNHIDGLVYLADVDKAKELLTGKTIYTLCSEGFQDTNMGVRSVRVKRFSPYKVKSIGVGDISPFVKIIATDRDGNDAAFFVIFSGTNSNSYTSKLYNGYFYDTFSFSNPKSKYPSISNEIWDLIAEGKVRIGMSKEACQLSWGKPKKINKTTGSYGVHEQWVYDSSYLYFENGKLTSIQN